LLLLLLLLCLLIPLVGQVKRKLSHERLYERRLAALGAHHEAMLLPTHALRHEVLGQQQRMVRKAVFLQQGERA